MKTTKLSAMAVMAVLGLWAAGCGTASDIIIPDTVTDIPQDIGEEQPGDEAIAPEDDGVQNDGDDAGEEAPHHSHKGKAVNSNDLPKPGVDPGLIFQHADPGKYQMKQQHATPVDQD